MKTFLFLALCCWVNAVTIVAAEPTAIVELQSDFLVGAHSNGKWLTSEDAGKKIKAGTPFRVYGLTREFPAAKGGKAVANTDVCLDVFTLPISPKPEGAAIALAAPWNALPRIPKILDATQAVYIQAAREFLQSHGIPEPKVKITKIVRIDLEGDGEEEVLLSATNYASKDGIPSSSTAGSYSFVLLRRVVGGKVQTQLIAGEFYPKAKTFSAPNQYEILAVLDLDGDGKMEVVVQSAYYEGGATSIYRCTPSKIQELVTVACGA